MNFWIAEFIVILLQFLLFTPFYITWRKDCKKIGKDNLEVPLSERFYMWLIFFPLWIVPIVYIIKY